jgi:hypothetical protein
VICVLLVRIVTHGITSFIAYDQEISNHWNNSGISFLDGVNSSEWNYDVIVSIYMSGPIAALFIGLGAVSAFTFHLLRNATRINFVLWTLIISFNYFFGSIVAGLFTTTDIAIVLKTMKIPVEFKVMGAILASYLLIRIAILIAPGLLRYSNEKSVSNKKNRFLFLTSKVLIPWITGNLVTFIILPEIFNTHYIIIQCVMLLMIIPVIIKGTLTNPDTIYLTTNNHNISSINIIILFCIILIYRFGFNEGLYFIY